MPHRWGWDATQVGPAETQALLRMDSSAADRACAARPAGGVGTSAELQLAGTWMKRLPKLEMAMARRRDSRILMRSMAAVYCPSRGATSLLRACSASAPLLACADGTDLSNLRGTCGQSACEAALLPGKHARLLALQWLCLGCPPGRLSYT